MEYQVLYEDCRKSLEVKSEKNMVCRVSKNDTRHIIALPSVRRRHSAKGNGGCRPLTAVALCRVFWFVECRTLGKPGLCRVLLFAECSALGKPPLCRVPVVCRVLSLWHSTNSLFAERPIKSTRQNLGHSAKKHPIFCSFCRLLGHEVVEY